MRANAVFVGFLTCPVGHHDTFLDWHERDHRPENHGLIEHIYHSPRFIAPPDSLAQREVAAQGPFSDPGEYLMTYWSSASPERLLKDMTALRERLQALGRCEPINRDFRAVWRDRMRVAKAYTNPRQVVSSDGAPLAPHDALVVTAGRYPDDGQEWTSWYDRVGVPGLFVDGRFTAAFTLTPMDVADKSLFVHFHFAVGPWDEALAGVRAATKAGPEILFRGVYVPQYAGRPRYYE